MDGDAIYDYILAMVSETVDGKSNEETNKKVVWLYSQKQEGSRSLQLRQRLQQCRLYLLAV